MTALRKVVLVCCLLMETNRPVEQGMRDRCRDSLTLSLSLSHTHTHTHIYSSLIHQYNVHREGGGGGGGGGGVEV
jgi:hypothetical protein